MEDMNSKIGTIWKSLLEKSEEKDLDRLAILQALKCTEELGEVADMVLRDAGANRKRKEIPKEEIRRRLGEEIADVMLALHLLAKNRGIDVNKSLREKIEIELERWEREAVTR